MATLFNIEFMPLCQGCFDEDDSSSFAIKLSLRGTLSIDDSSETELLIKTLYKGGIKKLILNLEHLSYIDSTGIGLIIRTKKNIVDIDGDLVLLNIPPKINEVFDLVNLKDFVKAFYSDQKAVEYLRVKHKAEP